MNALLVKLRTLAVITAASASIVAAQGSPSQDTPPSPCAGPEFRQFDFWLGSWSVADADGKLAGHNEITAEENGCLLVERWRSASGNTGTSINYYDPRLKQWRQHWAGLGLILEMSGSMRDNSMILEGPLQYLNSGKVTLLRGTWTALPDGRVRQHFVESADEGTTWSEWFDGYYTRSPPRTAHRIY